LAGKYLFGGKILFWRENNFFGSLQTKIRKQYFSVKIQQFSKKFSNSAKKFSNSVKKFSNSAIFFSNSVKNSATQ